MKTVIKEWLLKTEWGTSKTDGKKLYPYAQSLEVLIAWIKVLKEKTVIVMKERKYD